MIHLGVCYYPEHWPEERWATDARLMREAGLSVVRLAEFSWALLEPEEGSYDFAWLDRAIATLADAGLRIMLGTPTATPPAWLTAAHPDVLPVGADGQLRQPGSRRHYCATSELYWRATQRVVSRMAERYGRHPAVIGWQIDNELGCHDTVRCYCARCAYGFTRWLEHRYGTLEALNEAWGTVFWSQRYAEWPEILPPRGLVYDANPGHWLDWCRYSSQNQAEYLAFQAGILRELAPGQWLTHNLMGGFDELDHAKLVEPLDMVGWDNYMPPGVTPTHVAMAHDRMRGLLRRPFWVLEQQVGNINWGRYNPTLRPGEARLRTLQAIAHGAEGVLYFRWRAGLIGAEQLHSGILPHDGVPGRTYDEVKAIAAEVGQLPPLGPVVAPVALLYGEENRWALRLQPHHQDLRDEGPDAYDVPFYSALHRLGVGVDVVPPEAELSSYPVVVAATQYVMDEPLIARLRAYAEGGGQLVFSVRSGFKDASNRVRAGAIGDLVGARVAEWDSPAPEVWNAVEFEDGTRADVSRWMELLDPAEGTEVLARYTEDYYAEVPAIVRRPLGRGHVWYVGALGEGPDLAETVMRRVMASAAIPVWDLPEGVEVVTREKATFLLNHGETPASVTLPTGERVHLSGFDVTVLSP